MLSWSKLRSVCYLASPFYQNRVLSEAASFDIGNNQIAQFNGTCPDRDFGWLSIMVWIQVLYKIQIISRKEVCSLEALIHGLELVRGCFSFPSAYWSMLGAQ